MKRVVWLQTVLAVALGAAGFKVPENSLNSMALGAAYTAEANGADSAYYNPANMAFEDALQKAELDLTYIGLTPITFEGSAPTAGSGVPDSGGTESERETFFVPTVFYVSPRIGDFRFGFGALSPAGLSKRWNDQPGRGYANEFTLKTIEFNPAMAYRITPELAIGLGGRMIYTTGRVKSASTASRDMVGSGLDFGYNVALTYRPIDGLSLAAHYRSKVKLNVTGQAKLYYPDNGQYAGNLWYDDDAKVSVPIPAMLQLAAAYTFNHSTMYATTVEFVFHRDFWSSYQTLDFDYKHSLGALTPAFDEPIARDWSDANAYRLGVTQRIDQLTLMAAGAIDQTPVPERTLNFEMPDNDSWIVSAGFRYHLDTALSFGLAALYSAKYNRTIDGKVNLNGIDGTFKDAAALLATAGLEYRF